MARRIQTNEIQVQTSEGKRRRMRDKCIQVKTNERQVQTNETQVRTLVHLREDSRCLKAFTLLNLLTNLMFKISSLFPYFDYFGPFSRELTDVNQTPLLTEFNIVK